MNEPSVIKYIRKRDGRIEPFDIEKITEAIFKAAKAVGGTDRGTAKGVSDSILGILNILCKDERIPTVENIQDLVEKMLIERGHARVAKAYILYREQHRKIRDGKALLEEGLELVEEYLDRSDWRAPDGTTSTRLRRQENGYLRF